MAPPPIETRIPRRALFYVASLFGVSSTIQIVLLMRLNGEPI